MTDPREPIRLIASADADPLLRDALRAIHEDAPSVAALSAFADNAERALHEGSAAANTGAHDAGAHAAAHSYSLATKLVIAGGIVGALVYAGVQRARIGERALLDTPAETAAPVLVPAQAKPTPSTSGVRATDAHGPMQGADDERPYARTAAIDSHALGSAQPTVTAQPSAATPRSPASANVARPRETTHRVQRSANSAKPPAADASPQRSQAPQAPQTALDARDETQSPAPAEGEIELLESAQHALQREPRRALELLDQHRSAFPHGAFAQERDVLILEAFQRLHDTASLREGARAFMQRYPRSPHRARVEKLVEDLR